MSDIHHIFFLGIGGIGMSALARYFNRRGVSVHGYDRVETALTKTLQGEGIEVFYEDDPAQIPPAVERVIFTPAIRDDNQCYLHLRNRGVPFSKRAEVLGEISAKLPTIAVAGTHGKTTIGCMLTHILVTAGVRVEALLGGLPVNYNTNYIHTEGHPAWLVAEADEYDRSFLHLRPSLAVITAMDADHLDIYNSVQQLHVAFKEFAARVQADGTLLVKKGLENHFTYPGLLRTYSADQAADYQLKAIRAVDGNTHVSFTGMLEMPETKLGVPGRHNAENALAAAALAHIAGIEPAAIRKGLETFKGVKRRFEICYQSHDVVYIDDYAHHPVELRACILAARDLFPGKKVTGVFQPHLYTRTRDLAEGFAASLGLLDELIMLDIYPAREEPIEGIDAKWLMQTVSIPQKEIATKEELVNNILKRDTEVLITMGAGDIDRFAIPITKMLEERYH